MADSTAKARQNLYPISEAPSGFPSPDATQKLRDEADFQRAVTAYRFWYPSVSAEGIIVGNREVGAKDNDTMLCMALGPRQVLLTGNSDTPYAIAILDLKDGPWVVDLPPGPFICIAMDHHQRWISDMGIPGPDAGKGGKHLIIPPGYQGTLPVGYHVGCSSSNKVILGIRILPVHGDLKAALKTLQTVKVYPFSTASDPASLKYVDVTEKKMDSTSLRWEDHFTFWEKLHSILESEPIVDEFRPMYGLLSALGLEKGRPFKPDQRMKGILEKAAKTGRDQLIVSAFDSDRPDRIVWRDRKWEWIALVPDNGDFETPHGLDLEARDHWFAQAIGVSPAMFRRQAGSGSLYWLGHRDRNDEYLDGGKTYRLTIPHSIPAKIFWSVTVYDAQTRSQIQTDQDKAALRSLVELTSDKIGKDSGPIDLYFGPKAPEGKENRWIKTRPGRGWFAYFRIYGPEKAAFDGSWMPGDFERV